MPNGENLQVEAWVPPWSMRALPVKLADSDYGWVADRELHGCSREALGLKVKRRHHGMRLVWSPQHERVVPPVLVDELRPELVARARRDAGWQAVNLLIFSGVLWFPPYFGWGEALSPRERGVWWFCLAVVVVVALRELHHLLVPERRLAVSARRASSGVFWMWLLRQRPWVGVGLGIGWAMLGAAVVYLSQAGVHRLTGSAGAAEPLAVIRRLLTYSFVPGESGLLLLGFFTLLGLTILVESLIGWSRMLMLYTAGVVSGAAVSWGVAGAVGPDAGVASLCGGMLAVLWRLGPWLPRAAWVQMVGATLVVLGLYAVAGEMPWAARGVGLGAGLWMGWVMTPRPAADYPPGIASPEAAAGGVCGVVLVFGALLTLGIAIPQL